jgi:hypothetical protein
VLSWQQQQQQQQPQQQQQQLQAGGSFSHHAKFRMPHLTRQTCHHSAGNARWWLMRDGESATDDASSHLHSHSLPLYDVLVDVPSGYERWLTVWPAQGTESVGPV